MAKALAAAFNNRDASAVRHSLADDVRVIEDGTEIAASADQWMAQLSSSFEVFGDRFRVKGGYVDKDGLVLIHGRDCCDYNHITEFRLRGNRVIEVRRTTDIGLAIDGHGNRIDLQPFRRESF